MFAGRPGDTLNFCSSNRGQFFSTPVAIGTSLLSNCIVKKPSFSCKTDAFKNAQDTSCFKSSATLGAPRGFGAMGPKKKRTQGFFKRKLKHKSVRLFCLWDHMDFFFSMKWLNDPTITQQLQFASSTIMPSSGLELFFDISCPSLRCQAGPRGSKVPLFNWWPSPHTRSCQFLVRWQRSRLYFPGGIACLHAANPLEFGQNTKPFFVVSWQHVTAACLPTWYLRL